MYLAVMELRVLKSQFPGYNLTIGTFSIPLVFAQTQMNFQTFLCAQPTCIELIISSIEGKQIHTTHLPGESGEPSRPATLNGAGTSGPSGRYYWSTTIYFETLGSGARVRGMLHDTQPSGAVGLTLPPILLCFFIKTMSYQPAASGAAETLKR